MNNQADPNTIKENKFGEIVQHLAVCTVLAENLRFVACIHSSGDLQLRVFLVPEDLMLMPSSGLQ